MSDEERLAVFRLLSAIEYERVVRVLPVRGDSQAAAVVLLNQAIETVKGIL